jgi:hypothetical protein
MQMSLRWWAVMARINKTAPWVFLSTVCPLVRTKSRVLERVKARVLVLLLSLWSSKPINVCHLTCLHVFLSSSLHNSPSTAVLHRKCKFLWIIISTIFSIFVFPVRYVLTLTLLMHSPKKVEKQKGNYITNISHDHEEDLQGDTCF